MLRWRNEPAILMGLRFGLQGKAIALMGENFAIVNLDGLSAPATALIERVSEAVGGIIKPIQIKRIAEADAQAALIHTESEIKITELRQRAMHRLVNEEAKKQENMEAITKMALPELGEKSQPQNLEVDWITNFFDKCRIVSDAEMQQLRAKVLAGEANGPGRYSKRTINFLGSLGKEEATLFTRLCGFGWTIGGSFVPLVLDYQNELYTQNGINFPVLLDLESIGLITFNHIATFAKEKLPKQVISDYNGQRVNLTFQNEASDTLDIGHVVLTAIGAQIALIANPSPVDGFFDHVLTKWSSQFVVISSPYPRSAPDKIPQV